MLEELTNRNPLLVDELTQKEVSFIFSHWTYLLDYNYVERQHLQSINKSL